MENTEINQQANQASNQQINPNDHKKVGPIISTLVIVLVLIIAALYIFASRLNQQTLPADATDDLSVNATTTAVVQPITNKSTDVKSIQSDLDDSTKGLDQQDF